MIIIDGALGEGGGQILRSALSLSLATGAAFRIDNIRAKRAKPGLMRQHLTAVNAAAEISGATVRHADIGSTRLVFEPGVVRAGDYTFNIGSAGSTTLVLQTLLPPLALARDPSRLTLQGGTHNPGAPPFEFFDRAFLPLLRRIGYGVDAVLTRPGFYPAGGGEIVVTVSPATTLTPLQLTERGALRSCDAEASVANLPFHIAEREVDHLRQRLGWPEQNVRARTFGHARSQGNCLIASIAHEQVTEVFAGFGRIGVGAEQIAEETALAVAAYLENTHPIGEYLADQLLLPMALGAGGVFVTQKPSSHTLTNIAVIKRFLALSISVAAQDGGGWRISAV